MYNITQIANDIWHKVFNHNAEVTTEGLLMLMSRRRLINLGHAIPSDLRRFNVNALYRDICIQLSQFGYREAVVYLLKYVFGMSNDQIRNIGELTILTDTNIDFVLPAIDFRRIERMHMNISRRVYLKPEFTNPSFTTIGEILNNKQMISDIIETHSLHDKSVKYFQIYYIKEQLKVKSSNIQLRHIAKIIHDLKPEIIMVDVKEYPWNMIADIVDVPDFKEKLKLINIILEPFINFNDELNTKLQMKAKIEDVLSYNVHRLINDTAYLICRERYKNKKSLSAIKEAHDELPTPTRMQQIHANALHRIRRNMMNGKSIFNGLPEALDPDGNKIYQDLLVNRSHDVDRVINLILPDTDNLLLTDMYHLITVNPLVYNVFEYGYDKGLIKTNQELRRYRNNEMSVKESKDFHIPERIEEMGLSIRAYNALKRKGIDKVSDLSTMTISELRKVNNLGEKSLKEVLNRLSHYEIYLKDFKED